MEGQSFVITVRVKTFFLSLNINKSCNNISQHVT